MISSYIGGAVQRYVEFGGFAPAERAALPDSAAEWADAVLLRHEQGLTTLVALVAHTPEGALKGLRDDLTILADRMARQERTEVQVLLLLVLDEPLTRPVYDRWQELTVNRGAVRLVPWIVDLTRNQLFEHTGPPFGIDPDLALLAAPDVEAVAPVAEQAVRRPPLPRPWVTVGLIAVLVGIWVAMTVAGGGLMATEEVAVLDAWGAQTRPFMWLDGEYWRLFTANFIHIGFFHLASNCLSLWVVGRPVEALYGPWKMAAIYLLAGMAGAVASAAFGRPLAAAAGASGAVYGMIGALLWYSLSSPKRERVAWQPLVAVVVLNTVLGFTLGDAVDNWAHGGGLLGGLVTAAAVGVPAIAGLAAPRYRPGRPWRGALLALLVALSVAVSTGYLVPPGHGHNLALAMEEFDAGRYKQAEAGFLRALDVQGEASYLLHLMVMTEFQLGKCPTAQHYLARLAVVAPEYEELPELRAVMRQCR